jgi:diguanylate cyclase (GGDEF)-like protein/PAS domain S-box-containing protein
MKHRRKDGSLITVEVSIFPLHFAAQSANLVLINDITDREAMARNIVEREEMLSLLLDSTSEAIYGLGLDGCCTFANNACAALLGYDSPNELIGKHFHYAVHHTYEDGRPYPLDDCPLHRALTVRQGTHVEGEVLWRKDGSCFPVEYWSYPTMRDGAIVGCVVTFLDISERRRQREELEYQATHDALTGLLNRSVLLPRIDAAIADAQPSGAGFSVMVIDLDGFKEVNDALGHQSGDLLLKEVGKRILGALGDSDTLIRLGGDEFAVVFCSGCESDAAERAAQELLQAIREPFLLNELQVRISASIGIARYPQDGADSGKLMRQADIAMYRSKREGIGYSLYDHSEGERSANRILLMADVRNAISRGEFLLYFQPKVALSDGHTIGFEALARWQHHERGLISPAEFIPLIEVSDLIHPFTAWVLESAVAECARWHEDGSNATVAVNISTRNLLDAGLPERLKDCLHRHRLLPGSLELEITESSVMADPVRSLEVLTRLHQIGVKISIDDFGTGYSSLAYLQKLPVDSLKIDRSFVGQMQEHRDAMAIVSSIIGLAHTIDVSVVAEGIENESVMTALRELGCDYAQGYHVARPMPAHKARIWLKERMAA